MEIDKLFNSLKLFYSFFFISLFCVSAFQNCSKFEVSTRTNPQPENIETGTTPPEAIPDFSFTDVPSITTESSIDVKFKFQNFQNLKFKSITCSLNKKPMENCASGSIVYQLPMDDLYTLQVIATTSGGNKFEYVKQFRRDTLGPQISVLTEPSSTTSAASSSFVFSANDEMTEVVKTECSLDSAVFSNCVSPLTTPNLQEGLHSLQIKSYDRVGNTSLIEKKWIVDFGVLSIAFSTTPTQLSNDINPKFSFSSIGPFENVEYTCQLDTQVSSTCTSPHQINTISQGTHTLTVIAKTNNGKQSQPALVSWTVDTTQPTVVLSSLDSSLSQSRERTIMVEFSEVISDFSSNSFELDNGIIENFTGMGKFYSFKLIANSEGNFSVKLNAGAALDGAKNSSTVSNLMAFFYRPKETFDSAILTKLSNLCADSSATNSALKQQTCSGLNHQKFRITNLDDGFYKISPLNNLDKCFDWTDGNILDPCSSSEKQKWKLKYAADSSYLIASQDESVCLNVYSNSQVAGGTIGTFTCNSTAQNELFFIPGFKSGTPILTAGNDTQIRNQFSQKCLDNSDRTAKSVQKSCSSDAGQTFTFILEADGFFKIMSKSSPYWCLDFSDRNTLFKSCLNNNYSQKWQLIPGTDNSYLVKSENGKLCLSLSQESNADLVSTTLSDCKSTSLNPTQMFQLTGFPALLNPPTQVLAGAIRWDAWYSTSANPSATSIPVEPTLYTEFDYRKPFYGWTAISDSALTSGNPAPQDQLKMDREIDFANFAQLDYWAFVYYSSTTYIPNRGLSTALVAYKNSNRPKKPKYSLIIGGEYFVNPGWSPQVRVKEFLQDFINPNYLKVDGQRPVIFIGNPSVLFDYTKYPAADWNKTALGMRQYLIDSIVGSGPTCAGRLSQYACFETGLGTPYFVSILGGNSENTRLAQLDALSSYGTMVKNVHASWADLTQDDKIKNTPVPGLKIVPSITAVQDHRPRNSGSLWNSLSGGNKQIQTWYDIPTQSQWKEKLSYYKQQILRGIFPSANPGLLLIYAWNELDEGGGGLVPTKDAGTSLLAPLADFKAETKKSHYDLIDTTNLAISYKGIWAYKGPDQTIAMTPTHKNEMQHGLFGNDEMLTTDPNAMATLTWPKTYGFELIASLGPSRGSISVSCDGGTPTVVNLSILENESYPNRQVVAECNFTEVGVHTIQIKNLTTTSFGLDAIRAKISYTADTKVLPPLLSMEPYHDNFVLNWTSGSIQAKKNIYVSESISGPWTNINTLLNGNNLKIENASFVGKWISISQTLENVESELSNPIPLDQSTNLSRSSTITASQTKPNSFAENAIDGVYSPQSSWQGLNYNDYLQINLPTKQSINRVDLSEDASVSQTTAFKIQYCDQPPCSNDSVWKDAYAGRSIGIRRTITFTPVQASAVRLQFISGIGIPAVVEYGIYLY